jgi:hypothetical protein
MPMRYDPVSRVASPDDLEVIMLNLDAASAAYLRITSAHADAIEARLLESGNVLAGLGYGADGSKPAGAASQRVLAGFFGIAQPNVGKHLFRLEWWSRLADAIDYADMDDADRAIVLGSLADAGIGMALGIDKEKARKALDRLADAHDGTLAAFDAFVASYEPPTPKARPVADTAPVSDDGASDDDATDGIVDGATTADLIRNFTRAIAGRAKDGFDADAQAAWADLLATVDGTDAASDDDADMIEHLMAIA